MICNKFSDVNLKIKHYKVKLYAKQIFGIIKINNKTMFQK